MKEDSECGKVHIKNLKPSCLTGKQILVSFLQGFSLDMSSLHKYDATSFHVGPTFLLYFSVLSLEYALLFYIFTL